MAADVRAGARRGSGDEACRLSGGPLVGVPASRAHAAAQLPVRLCRLICLRRDPVRCDRAPDPSATVFLTPLLAADREPINGAEVAAQLLESIGRQEEGWRGKTQQARPLLRSCKVEFVIFHLYLL